MFLTSSKKEKIEINNINGNKKIQGEKSILSTIIKNKREKKIVSVNNIPAPFGFRTL